MACVENISTHAIKIKEEEQHKKELNLIKKKPPICGKLM